MNVSIHADCVGSKEAGGGRKSKLQKFLFQVVGAFSIGRKGGGNLLKMIVGPNAEPIKEAAGTGNNKARREWRLMNLHKKVKIRERVTASGGSSKEEFPFLRSELRAVFSNPVEEFSTQGVTKGLCFINS